MQMAKIGREHGPDRTVCTVKWYQPYGSLVFSSRTMDQMWTSENYADAVANTDNGAGVQEGHNK
jgi:hypothetical protein